MTKEAFLDWESRQESRYEFDGFAAVAMTGGTGEHSSIQVNLIAALMTRLWGSHWRTFGSQLKIEVSGSIRYPDVMVVGTHHPRGTLVVPDPTVVFEIVSPSSARIDRIVKAAEYFGTPSIQSYVLLEQDFRGATVMRRGEGRWTAEPVGGDGTIQLAEIGVELLMTELYEDVDMPEETPDT